MAISTSIIGTCKEALHKSMTVTLEKVFYIHYPVQFQKKKNIEVL